MALIEERGCLHIFSFLFLKAKTVKKMLTNQSELCRLKNIMNPHFCLCSVTVMPNSLWPHGLQHARLPSSLSPGICSVSCPLSWWCHLTISFSATPFSFCFLSFPESFPKSWLFASCDQRIGASALAPVLPMNIQDWFPLGLTGWISLQSKGLWRVFSNTTVQKSINSSALSFLYSSTLTTIHDYWKNHSFD